MIPIQVSLAVPWGLHSCEIKFANYATKYEWEICVTFLGFLMTHKSPITIHGNL